MSGGAFDHNDHVLKGIATAIEHEIANQGKVVDGWKRPTYSKRTLRRMQQAADTCRRAAWMAHRVDWLISGDDGEDTFHEEWDKSLRVKEL